MHKSEAIIIEQGCVLVGSEFRSRQLVNLSIHINIDLFYTSYFVLLFSDTLRLRLRDRLQEEGVKRITNLIFERRDQGHSEPKDSSQDKHRYPCTLILNHTETFKLLIKRFIYKIRHCIDYTSKDATCIALLNPPHSYDLHDYPKLPSWRQRLHSRAVCQRYVALKLDRRINDIHLMGPTGWSL